MSNVSFALYQFPEAKSVVVSGDIHGDWYYGHFHQSWHSSIDGVLFKMLDIMELTELRR